ncbi:bifunctional proline dehydrogenase/L-glutamate gamma-semialdehyde dehydrogenase PutA [Chitinibacter tainanensis]|uniref:bifunctional proline dehydrogenase/L-glutamate gamma-semialdehyde dehydrogenase PutA n=1 Tax=Chitinibacter tainanensis TaxID=230667 RepID=UPI0004157676|nr:bifunctional proline dehydrogenase/L-glutamate gamma-semialdehyde dehydrogenase PutA [Chitinibacter tainanensis]
MLRLPTALFDLPRDLLALTQLRAADEARLASQQPCTGILGSEQQLRADAMGHLLSQKVRQLRQATGGLDALLAQFPLHTPAGRALLNLAEGVLRIPDDAAVSTLIAEQLHAADWHALRGQSPSWQINLATLGLDLAESWSSSLTDPLIRESIRHALLRLANQFVIADHIQEALQQQASEFRYSFDMLGESAMSQSEARRYGEAYAQAIEAVGQYSQGAGYFGPSVSVKLSALHPKFQLEQADAVQEQLYPQLYALAERAMQLDIGLTIDAEESARQLLTLQLFARLMHEPKLREWAGLGIAVQAYQKNALEVVKWLNKLSRELHKPISVRLVKGAYWDSEIKLAQQAALSHYPVWTEKSRTDQHYLACAQVLLQAPHRIFPQFATHNAFTIAQLHLMGEQQQFEYQALLGMGEGLYQAASEMGIERPCRLYAPVGDSRQLLPYLVRRFLENGANTSFMHQLFHPPVTPPTASKRLKPPNKLYLPRETPAQIDPAMLAQWQTRIASISEHTSTQYLATGLIHQYTESNTHKVDCFNPAQSSDRLGAYCPSQLAEINVAFAAAEAAAPRWRLTPVLQRAQALEQTANLLEQQAAPLLNLLVREAGKTWRNAEQELREAIDFCRYYAQQARQHWLQQAPQPLGVVVAISPWNFPLAIFTGQIAAALIAGNPVLAKPAPETPLIASLAVQCFHRAGIGTDVLQLLLGGTDVGAALTLDHRCQGVAFTGSLTSARKIEQAIAAFGPDRVLVAETGGVNILLADNTAHPEQLLRDLVQSAFDSAGQRCSAARILCIEEPLASQILPRLREMLAELCVGDPSELATEMGPLISAAAKQRIEARIQAWQSQGLAVWRTRCTLPSSGHFLSPTLVEISDLKQAGGEVFGPVLQVLRYPRKGLDKLLRDVAALGDGLTMGIHTRLEETIQRCRVLCPVGNVYINRNQIGALVGGQPFGGLAGSGTGPKAGGPWAIWRWTRDGDPCQPHYAELADTFSFLRSLSGLWPDLDQSVDLEILWEDAARRSPLGQPLPLPGPTGEDNTLHYQGRGLVACLGHSEWLRLQQAGIALLTGNTPVLPATDRIQDWARKLGERVIFCAEPLAEKLAAVMYSGPDAHLLRQQLAKRSGAIVPLILPFEDGHWPLYQLVAEITVSRNTAAQGGDIGLLTHQAE